MCFTEAEHNKAKHKEHAADTMHQTHGRNSRGQEELNMTQTSESNKERWTFPSITVFLGEVKSPTDYETIIKKFKSISRSLEVLKNIP